MGQEVVGVVAVSSNASSSIRRRVVFIVRGE
jgi:hypothetical protein